MGESTGHVGQQVGLVFVSHSALIADGLVELARQMAPRAILMPAGGTDEGGIGTSFLKVSEGMLAAVSAGGVVVLCDLGSAILTAETALEFLDDDVRARIRIVDAPLVEGGVAAAVAAEIGGDIDAVEAAALSAVTAGEVEATPTSQSDAFVTRSVTLVNRDGLHARPAAEFVTLASTFDAAVSVNGTDATSLLGIMSLGLARGMTVEISSSGSEAAEAVTALVALLESGFGEEHE
ncbi:dihydroxyacetone kinase phosphoryl donor subunit DhaM [Cryobacterium psychrophilum]|uniref:Phosphocarrier protein HPr n=1 Tax=Cryobacterium psychrophilum TaxID=41988 RepID=A0A4Y8KPI4_9MICO|nr:dihydroxyacetone kinase phosphoryl donor subunit DhaM [Cryobacterium psychrophilum]TDW28500.1 PTS hybrid protein [Cryobacterium psychrophilum]TFD80497.1 HPr family phosphocarrier protein [Cryobacterium psychrophilum]